MDTVRGGGNRRAIAEVAKNHTIVGTREYVQGSSIVRIPPTPPIALPTPTSDTTTSMYVTINPATSFPNENVSRYG